MDTPSTPLLRPRPRCEVIGVFVHQIQGLRSKAHAAQWLRFLVMAVRCAHFEDSATMLPIKPARSQSVKIPGQRPSGRGPVVMRVLLPTYLHGKKWDRRVFRNDEQRFSRAIRVTRGEVLAETFRRWRAGNHRDEIRGRSRSEPAKGRRQQPWLPWCSLLGQDSWSRFFLHAQSKPRRWPRRAWKEFCGQSDQRHFEPLPSSRRGNDLFVSPP